MKRHALILAGSLLAATHASAQTMRIGMNEDSDVLDPARGRTTVGRIVFASLCDKLVDIDPQLNLVPQLATSWSWSADGLTLTFKLRPNVKFQDDEPLNAAAVKFSIDRAKSLPDSMRKSEISSVTSVDVVDDLTVAVHVGKPDATLVSQFADRAGMVVSPQAAADVAAFGRHPVCAGPYKFAERVQDDRVVLDKFDGYWDAANYHFAHVVFRYIPDTTVRLANLRSGDLDLGERMAPSDAASIRQDAGLVLMPVIGLGYRDFTLNVGNGARAKTAPWGDKRVRQAFQLSIDRDVINQVAGDGMMPPAQQPFPTASPYSSKDFAPTHRDVARAKALLQAAGMPNPKFELMFGNATVEKQVAELVQAMAAEAGFEIALRPTEFAASLREAQAGNFDAEFTGWSGRVDPDGNTSPFLTCQGSQNDGRYCNPEVDRLLAEARTTADPDKRKPLYDAAQKILHDELPIIYTYFQTYPFVTVKKVKGFVAYPDGMVRLKGVSFAE